MQTKETPPAALAPSVALERLIAAVAPMLVPKPEFQIVEPEPNCRAVDPFPLIRIRMEDMRDLQWAYDEAQKALSLAQQGGAVRWEVRSTIGVNDWMQVSRNAYERACRTDGWEGRALFTHPAAVDAAMVERAYDAYETTLTGYYVFEKGKDNRAEAWRVALTAALQPAATSEESTP